ncbi:hypothetical protein [Halobellus rarus]|uniref:DUF7993 domain-containing protein n=1 Tax=Halobellus rarus TaxID=1126237 RepID=A0ABD6CMJ5_9EURY|nr:hypothetical protein [Halobellus rarus]
MVEERLTSGRRIAQFLASEVTGHGDDLDALTVTDADPDVEPTPDGAFAYSIDRDGERVASVFVQPERVRVEFQAAADAVAEVASAEGLRVRPKAVEPPRALVFVEDGAQVKWLLPALRAVAAGPDD